MSLVVNTIHKISSYMNTTHQKKIYHVVSFINIAKEANKFKLTLYKLLKPAQFARHQTGYRNNLQSISTLYDFVKSPTKIEGYFYAFCDKNVSKTVIYLYIFVC